MDILSNLIELLKRRSRVAVPGLGTFDKHRIPGRYDAGNHTFVSPSLQFTFDHSVAEDDDLSSYVAEYHEIAGETAEFYVSKFVKDILEKLKGGDSVKMHELGSLHVVEDKIVLSPSEDSGKHFFGLPSIGDGTTKPSAEKSDEHELTVVDPPTHSLIETPEQFWNFKTETETVVAPEPATEEHHSKNNPGFKLLAIMAAVVAVVAATYLLFGDQILSVAGKAGQKRDKADSKKAAPASIPHRPDSLKSTVAIASSGDSLKKDSVISAQIEMRSDTTWEVIGASVINQKEADRFIAQMKKIGIAAKVIPTAPGKRRIKISVATFGDEQSARAGRKELVLKLKNPELYIHQNRQTHK
ncbi:SPOR domain-containing protein [Pedobacter faecalis]|uniref:HU domain-containing protein n=1 Tax=Pedobacter faecalis TaxID=3041495 RepID=UPI0025503BCD|nr:SPOR domain-containing protein [Pedobacter sp. ELA7]